MSSFKACDRSLLFFKHHLTNLYTPEREASIEGLELGVELTRIGISSLNDRLLLVNLDAQRSRPDIYADSSHVSKQGGQGSVDISDRNNDDLAFAGRYVVPTSAYRG